MEVMQKEEPTRTLKFEGTEYAMTPNVALTFLQKDLKSAKTRCLETTIKKTLGQLSLAAALAAVLIAALTFLKVKSASLAAMKSRDHLLRAFRSTRHLLPLASTSVTVAIALSLTSLLLYESMSVVHADLADGTRFKLVLACGLMALASLWLVVKAVFSLPSACKLFKPAPPPAFRPEYLQDRGPRTLAVG